MRCYYTYGSAGQIWVKDGAMQGTSTYMLALTMELSCQESLALCFSL